MASFSFGYESHTSINHVCLLHAETRFHLPSQELLLLDICIFRLFFLFFSWDFYFPHYFLRCQTSFLLTSQRATEGFMLVTSIGDGVSVHMDPRIVTRINAGYCLVVGVNCEFRKQLKNSLLHHQGSFCFGFVTTNHQAGRVWQNMAATWEMKDLGD